MNIFIATIQFSSLGCIIEGKKLHHKICLSFIIVRMLDWKSNIYFWLRFGLASAINRVVCVGNFYLNCLLIEFIIPNLSHIFFVYKKYLKRTYKTVFFLVQNHRLNLFSRVVNSQRLFWSQRLVRNVRIKAFW